MCEGVGGVFSVEDIEVNGIMGDGRELNSVPIIWNEIIQTVIAIISNQRKLKLNLS